MITDTSETHTFGPLKTTTEDHPTKRDKKKKRKPHMPAGLVIIVMDSMKGAKEIH